MCAVDSWSNDVEGISSWLVPDLPLDTEILTGPLAAGKITEGICSGLGLGRWAFLGTMVIWLCADNGRC